MDESLDFSIDDMSELLLTPVDIMELTKINTLNNTTMKQDKLDILKQLSTIFEAKQFVVTGSTIAALQGLTTKTGDIDIVLIEPKESTIEQLKRFVEQFPIHNAEVNKRLGENKMFVFKFNNQKVDVFIKYEMYDEKLQYAGYIISPLMRLVEAKKGYCRLKDIMQLKSWAEMMYKSSELEKELDRIAWNNEYK